MGLSKKYCALLLVLIFIVILGTTLGILFGIGVIETGGYSHHSSVSSGGDSEVNLEENSGGDSGGDLEGNSGGSSGEISKGGLTVFKYKYTVYQM